METNANPNFANQTPQLLFENRTSWKLNSCMQGLDLSLHRVDSEEGGVLLYLKLPLVVAIFKDWSITIHTCNRLCWLKLIVSFLSLTLPCMTLLIFPLLINLFRTFHKIPLHLHLKHFLLRLFHPGMKSQWFLAHLVW